MPDSQLIQSSQRVSTALIRQSHFFASLPPHILNEVAQYFRFEAWPGRAYINPDVLNSHFRVLLEGELEVTRTDPESGREVTLDTYYPGDSFDVVTLLDGQAHDVILQAISGLRLIAVPIETMRNWLWSYPELNRQFMHYLSGKIREQEDLSSSFVLHDVRTRLSRQILKHIRKSHIHAESGDIDRHQYLIPAMSDERLARMVGSVRQVVNKQLAHWKSQGVVNKKRNQLMINDLDRLKQEARETLSVLSR